MRGFKIFDGYRLKKDENIEKKINEWLNEEPDKEIIQINQSVYHDGHLIITILYSTK